MTDNGAAQSGTKIGELQITTMFLLEILLIGLAAKATLLNSDGHDDDNDAGRGSVTVSDGPSSACCLYDGDGLANSSGQTTLGDWM